MCPYCFLFHCRSSAQNTLFRFVSFAFRSSWLAFLGFTIFFLIMTDLKVCLLNVRGLGEQLKRREIFNFLPAKKYSIYLLQETHISENTNPVWSSEWDLKLESLFTFYYSTNRRSCYSLEQQFHCPTSEILLDNIGTFIICESF